MFRFYERSNTPYSRGDMVCWFVCDGLWCPLWVVSPRSVWTVSLVRLVEGSTAVEETWSVGLCVMVRGALCGLCLLGVSGQCPLVRLVEGSTAVVS